MIMKFIIKYLDAHTALRVAVGGKDFCLNLLPGKVLIL